MSATIHGVVTRVGKRPEVATPRHTLVTVGRPVREVSPGYQVKPGAPGRIRVSLIADDGRIVWADMPDAVAEHLSQALADAVAVSA